MTAREFQVRGRVQGVGFRWFVKKEAHQLGVKGYVRNEADGNVFVYAVGTERQLSQLAARLHRGPRFAEVRGVDEREAAVRKYETFEIED
ncbi:MAG: acylphosphatase [Acidobacteriota bacterium]|nr:acylphosphatase [Acidobacteriota bacterium]